MEHKENCAEEMPSVRVPWLGRSLTKSELTKYLQILVEEVPAYDALKFLEGHFAPAQLESHKVTAIGCVRLRDDMDERMRIYREKDQIQSPTTLKPGT